MYLQCRQADFVAWAGLDIARSYAGEQDASARELSKIIDEVKASGVSGVVDNYQSGPDAGLPLALELGVPHITLSNFPGSDDDVPDYFSLLRANVMKLARL